MKIAVDMVRERLITKREAVLRVEPGQVDQLLHRRIDPMAKVKVLATGLAASPGAAYGAAVFDADRAEARAKKGEKVILVRIETNPDDVHGMIAAEGVLTSRGGRTSHAAVVARGMGKPCVAGAGSVQVDLVKRQFTAGGTTIKEGEPFTIDGSTGNVIAGQVAMLDAEISGELEELLRWADSFRRLQVWANGDYPHDAVRARDFGAQGIGLCRTEHMFMQQERLPIVQKMILAPDEKSRRVELAKLLPMQRDDFHGILKAMHGLPVIIRLIDPPLHEFLPSLDELLVEVTRDRGARQAREVVSRKEGTARRGTEPARAEPDAGSARMPARTALSRDHRDAGAGHHRSRRRAQEGARRRAPRNHGAACRHARRVAQDTRGHRPHGAGGLQGDQEQGRVPRRDDDRGAARSPYRRDRSRSPPTSSPSAPTT